MAGNESKLKQKKVKNKQTDLSKIMKRYFSWVIDQESE